MSPQNALLKAIEKSGFRNRADSEKLIAAMETSTSLRVRSSRWRAQYAQAGPPGDVPLYIGTVKGGKGVGGPP